MADERGASIIMALFLLMICAVVAAIIVAYASANSGRSMQRVNEQQEYYALTSALSEAKDMFGYSDSAKPQGTAPLNQLAISFPNTGTATGYTVTPGGTFTDPIAKWVIEQACNVRNNTTTSTLSFTVTTSDENLPPVTLTYAMNGTGDNKYAITITGTTGDDAGYASTLETTIEGPAPAEQDTLPYVVTWGGQQS